MKKFSTLLHQPLHLPHLALQEAVDADLAPVGVEDDGGEAGEKSTRIIPKSILKHIHLDNILIFFCIFAA